MVITKKAMIKKVIINMAMINMAIDMTDMIDGLSGERN
jgi:hypothetical protein